MFMIICLYHLYLSQTPVIVPFTCQKRKKIAVPAHNHLSLTFTCPKHLSLSYLPVKRLYVITRLSTITCLYHFYLSQTPLPNYLTCPVTYPYYLTFSYPSFLITLPVHNQLSFTLQTPAHPSDRSHPSATVSIPPPYMPSSPLTHARTHEIYLIVFNRVFCLPLRFLSSVTSHFLLFEKRNKRKVKITMTTTLILR